MRHIIIQLAGLLIPFLLNAQDTILINDFGLEPDSRVNATSFINKAMQKCRGKENIVLAFKKGRYDFWQQYATEKNYFESNTTYTNPRYCALVVEKMKHFCIDGRGSDFVFHGKFQPFSVDSSENISIKNVSVDWEIPFGAEAEIMDVTSQYFDLKIDPRLYPYIVENDKLWFVGEGWKNRWGGVKWNDPVEFDRETLTVTAETHDDVLGGRWEDKYKAKEIGEGMVRIAYDKNSLLKKGNYLVLRHGVRDHAGIYIQESKNVLLENINMYSNSGISYLAQYSENITLRKANCLPGPKRKIMSGHDDGLHFSNCKGKIITENCILKGLMDDSYNVHGTYVIVSEVLNDKSLLCRFPHHQSFGLTWARSGETIAVINGRNMKNNGECIVEAVKVRTPEFFEITFKDIIPKETKKGDALENISWEPEVLITRCYFGSHRARGVLVSTGGKIVIDDNVFESSGAAIVFPGDIKEYFENGPIKNAEISNNKFKVSCLTSEYMTSEAVITVGLEVPELALNEPCIHRNISIINNDFEMHDFPALYALSVDRIVFSYNKIRYSDRYKTWHKNKQTLTFNACKHIQVKGNVMEKEVPGKNIKLIRTKPKELQADVKQGFSVSEE